MKAHHFSAIAQLCLLLAAGGLLTGCISNDPHESLRQSVTLSASFDQGLNADFAAGDPRLHGAVHRAKPQAAAPGLPEGDAIQLARGEGVRGDALRFTRKSDAIVFFKNPDNFHYRSTNWSGSISFWLKLDPDKDLQPGYCDPFQVVGGNWANGVFFAEFSKDETPRKFRFALRPLASIWNPKNVGWEDIAAADRPMVQISNPPFGRDRWTHVVFTFENGNTGRKDGIGTLYLNGEKAGEFRNWDLTVNWKPENVLLNIGVFYVGLFDELALFNRALTPAEVKTVQRGFNFMKAPRK